MPRVPECLSAQVLSECLRTQVPEWPSALSTQVPSALRVPNFSLSTLRVNKVWNITRNGLANRFIEFLKIFQNTYFYITVIVFYFLGNKTYKFYTHSASQMLSFKEVSKTFLKYFVKFQKTNMMEPGALFLVKL